MLVPKDKILIPSSKRQKLDKAERNSHVVTMVTTLPTFYKGIQFTGLVVLSWTRSQDDDVPSRHVTCCEYVHLDLEQLINGHFSISESKAAGDTKRDLIALRAVSIQTMVRQLT